MSDYAKRYFCDRIDMIVHAMIFEADDNHEKTTALALWKNNLRIAANDLKDDFVFGPSEPDMRELVHSRIADLKDFKFVCPNP